MESAPFLSQGATPLSGIEILRERARQALDPAVWDYLEAGTGEGSARCAVEAWNLRSLRPHILGGVEAVDVSTNLLGRSLALPILTAPNGRATLFCRSGELALLEATEGAGTIALLPSSVAIHASTLRALRPKARFWQQLYMAAERQAMRDLLISLTEAGCEAIVLTVDLLPGVVPVPPRPEAAPWERASGRFEPAKAFTATSFDDLAWLCREAGVPVLVKGVLRSDDALRCIEAGAAGLIVSNHGGNQLDTVIPSAEALVEVVEACGDRTEILVDGGLRTGASILKALAMGARAVLIGRPTSYALAAGGADAVVAMLGTLKAELERAMALCGASSIEMLERSLVTIPSL